MKKLCPHCSFENSFLKENFRYNEEAVCTSCKKLFRIRNAIIPTATKRPGNGKIFFWSDPHFHHKHILRFCDRPWNSLPDMHEGLIKNYNSVVGPNDTCIWVGDCFFCGSQEAAKIMDRLQGKKVLVTGNHDQNTGTMYNCGFDFVCEKLVLKIADQEVNVCHFPYAEPKWFTWWKKLTFRKRTRYLERRLKDEGKWLLHGHTHSIYKLREKQIHVGVDAWDFKPVSIDVIRTIIETGRLPGGKDADNRFKYHIDWMVGLGSWVKGVARIWGYKAQQKRDDEADVS